MYNLLSDFDFGQYKDSAIWAIAVCHPSYIDWCITNVDHFTIEDFDTLQSLPLMDTDKKSIVSQKMAEQLRSRVANNPNLYDSLLPKPYILHEYLTDKGYDFYIENFKPFLTRHYTYSKKSIEVNAARLKIYNSNPSRFHSSFGKERSYDKYNGAHGFDDDTIDNAFEGDPDNCWNID